MRIFAAIFLCCYFYPRPPRGGRQASGVLTTRTYEFLSTPSARRATAEHLTTRTTCSNFYPRPPRGGRPELIGKSLVTYSKFLSTPSARRATVKADDPEQRGGIFLSTPSARRATIRS